MVNTAREGRWQKALEEKPDDDLIQFGHNTSHAPDKPESTRASTDYKDHLRRYINESRKMGATRFSSPRWCAGHLDAQGKIKDGSPAGNPTACADATKAIGREENMAVVDLHASSQVPAEKPGPEASAERANKKGDATPFNEKGARAMADLVMKERPTAAPKPQKGFVRSVSDAIRFATCVFRVQPPTIHSLPAILKFEQGSEPHGTPWPGGGERVRARRGQEQGAPGSR